MRNESDAELLKAFAETNDSAAFAELVSRHGPLVYRVCFRKLINRQDAEDASQAVFMTLIKKSKELRREGSLAGWLHTVARQTSLFMARTRVHRLQCESAAAEIMGAESHPQITASDREIVLGFVDNELSSLPSAQKNAVILRYFEGLSEKDASEVAGCSGEAFRRRASYGISNLRKRLVSRGCALGVPALIGVLGADAQAAIPQTLIPSLLAVPKLAAAGAAAGTASAQITYIMEGALKTMAITKIKTAGLGILIALLIGTSAVVAVKEIQKRQNSGASDKPDIVASPAKQKVPDQPKSSGNDETVSTKLETKDKIPSVKVKQLPKARNFQAEAEKALETAKKIPTNDNWDTLYKIMEKWLEIDQVAASEWALKLPEIEKICILQYTAERWAGKNPVAASEWAMKLPEEQSKTSVLMYVASTWAKTDPLAAHEWTLRLPEGNGRDNASANVFAQWSEKDPATAAEWALKLPEGQEKNWGLGSVIGNWAKADPVAAYDWVQSLPDEKTRNMLWLKVPEGWAEKDPVAAAEWTLKLPEGTDRVNALICVAGQWVRKDPVAATEWILRLPEGEGRDIALKNVVSGLTCSGRNPENALKWIEESSLSQDEKEKLLKEIDKK